MARQFWAKWAARAGLLLWAMVAPAALAQTVSTPSPGSALRKNILDALRAPVERDLGPPVVFKADMLRVTQNWALMTGVPQRPGGRAIDYSKTRWAGAKRDGMFDDNVQALLLSEQGRWRVVTYVIGATDVSWAAWPDKYPTAPKALFPRSR